jgi:hypothetical protein
MKSIIFAALLAIANA